MRSAFSQPLAGPGSLAEQSAAKLDLRRVAFFLALAFIFAIAMENVVLVSGVGRVSKLVGLLTGAVWLAVVFMSGKLRRPRAFHYLALAFVGWNCLSLFWTVDIQGTLERVATYAQMSVMILFLWDLLPTRSDLNAAFQAYVLGAYVSISGTVFSFLIGDQYYHQRYAAAGFHPNGLAIVIVLGIPMAWYLATTARDHRHLFWRVINFAYLPLAGMAVALTGTRTGIVAAVPALAYVVTSLSRVRPVVRALIVVAMIAAVVKVYSVVPAASFQRLATIGTEFSEGDLNGRIELWRDGFEIFRDHTAVGIGSNAFKSVVESGKVAHNAFISVAVELGIFGIALFGSIVALVFYHAWIQPKWMSRCCLALLFTWALGVSALTWEHRKQTWLTLSFIVISAYALTDPRDSVKLADRST